MSEPIEQCTFVLPTTDPPTRCVRDAGHEGSHSATGVPKGYWWDPMNFEQVDDGPVSDVRLVNYRRRAEGALMRNEERTPIFAKDLLALTKELGHHRQGTAKRPKTAAEAIADLDDDVRARALAAAATIPHGTVGTLLSHARDCERYLRGES